jgi:hypothetical protein
MDKLHPFYFIHTNYKKSYRLQNQSVKPSRQLQQLTNPTNINQQQGISALEDIGEKKAVV